MEAFIIARPQMVTTQPNLNEGTKIVSWSWGYEGT